MACDLTIHGFETCDVYQIGGSLPKGSSISVEASGPTAKVIVDLHHIHYGGHLLGAARRMREIRALGRWSLDKALTGNVVLFGGGGPLGQMYLKRLLLGEPRWDKITVVDRIPERLRRVRRLLRLWGCASPGHVETLQVPAIDIPTRGVDHAMRVLDERPDAVVVFCTSCEVVQRSLGWVSDRGLVNVFAGMPPGSSVEFPFSDLERGVTLYGRSGSTVAESRLAVERLRATEVDLFDVVASNALPGSHQITPETEGALS